MCFVVARPSVLRPAERALDALERGQIGLWRGHRRAVAGKGDPRRVVEHCDNASTPDLEV